MPSIIGKLGAHQPVKADAFLRGSYGKGAMGLRRYAHHELATVGEVRHRYRRLFIAGLHILDALCHQLPNPGKGLFLRGCQPAQQRKFGAQPNELAILSGPGNSASVVFRVYPLVVFQEL